ncbi:WXG100 family type VII secretion target [Mangrovihabitans endophyticus]|uniref:WXG100 family type VII secretion target n=1 Tax=Mangrovihabitans endophyticus TaxID=1751298 RepID=UPI00166E0E4C|nr:WXG100 family type VII secretion target [Mangrovihabitans endophyticus]
MPEPAPTAKPVDGATPALAVLPDEATRSAAASPTPYVGPVSTEMHRTVHGRDEAATTQVSNDGVTVVRNADGTVTREELPDGTVFDRFDAEGKPTHGSVPGKGGPSAVDIAYHGDGESTWTYHDHGKQTVVTRHGDHVVREKLPDGTVFDRFNADGKPTHGSVPGKGGPSAVDIAYHGDGESTWTYHDHGKQTVITRHGDHVVREKLPDGTVFDRFNADGKPTHGSVPGKGGPSAVDIAYHGDGESTWTYHHGGEQTVITRHGDHVVREKLPDGTVFDHFNADGKPTHGSVPGKGGPSAVDIAYHGHGESTWTYHHGGKQTVITRHGDHVVREELPDGTVFDRFNADGKPTHGSVPGKHGPSAVDIAYHGDGESTWTYHDHGRQTVITRHGDHVVREKLPDGTVFDRFNADGKPTHGSVPGKHGPSAVDIAYHGDGESTWTYHHGGKQTVITRHGDHVVREKLPDGTVFDRFNADGKPTHGSVPGKGGPSAVDIAYHGHGESTWTYHHGGKQTVITRHGDHVVREKLPDGTVFDHFNADGKPTHGSVPGKHGPSAVDIAYHGNGESTWTYHDHGRQTVITRHGDHVVREKLPDGTVFDRFNADGKPTHGSVPGKHGPSAVDIAYHGHGESTWTYHHGGKQTVITRHGDHVVREKLPDGTVFDHFNADGKPTHGSVPGKGGPSAVDIAYHGDGESTWTYHHGGKQTVITRHGDHVVREKLPDGTVFDHFNADGKPTHGSVPGKGGASEVDVAYRHDTSVWTYHDHGKQTVVTRHGDHVVREKLPDGTVFDRFNADGKPTHGSVPGKGGPSAVDVAYHGNGESTWTYHHGGEQTVITRHGDHVVREKLPDGTVFDRFNADGKPTHGSVPGKGGPSAVDVAYHGNGESTWTYHHGGEQTVITRHGDHVVREKLPDGTVFDHFNADGKPTHGSVPGKGGPSAVDIAYHGHGESTWTYHDHGRQTVITRHGDHVVREKLPDGTVFDRFNADGKPTHGSVPGKHGPSAVDIAYHGHGESTWTYHHGGKQTVITRHGDHVVREKLPDGTVFDHFNAEGQPTHGSVPGKHGPSAVDIAYHGNGESTWTYHDHGRQTVITRHGDHVVREKLPDGTVFDRFNADGKPTHGSVPGKGGASEVDVAYRHDTSVWTYHDHGKQTVVTRHGDHVVREELPDGTVFDRFNADGKPTHGSVPGKGGPSAVDIAYHGDGESTWTYHDHGKQTVIKRHGDHVAREELPDGTVFDRFNADGKPTHGSVPGKGGPSAVDIAHHGDGESTWTYHHGGKQTVITRHGDHVVREKLPDGTVFDRFNADGKPTHGSVPGKHGPSAVDIAHHGDGESTWTYHHGGKQTVITRHGDDVVREKLPDGTVFDRFNAEGKPTHGSVPGKGGPSAVDIAYHGDGESTWTYHHGGKQTVITRHGDDVVREKLPDGTVFDRFNADGKPTHGSVPGKGGASEVDVAYRHDTSVWTYHDHGKQTVITRHGDDVVREKLPDGTVFDRFNAEGKPTHGSVPGKGGPTPVDIAYHGGGTSTWTYHEGSGPDTVVTKNAHGDVTRMVADGWTFDRFDDHGRPVSGFKTSDDQQTVSVRYTGDGGSIWTVVDGDQKTILTKDADGNPLRLVSGGWTYTDFDGQGRPVSGFRTGDPSRTITIDYRPGGGSVWHYGGGVTVVRNGKGDVVRMRSHGWTYDKFDDKGRPTHGRINGGDRTVTIRYDHGQIAYFYTSKSGKTTILVTDRQGHPIAQIAGGKTIQYAVEIPKLLEATHKVGKEREHIRQCVATLKDHLNAIMRNWNSPAGHNFEEVARRFNSTAADLIEVLDRSVDSMRKSYDNYLAAEGGTLKGIAGIDVNLGKLREQAQRIGGDGSPVSPKKSVQV